jgi:hypothetical protein
MYEAFKYRQREITALQEENERLRKSAESAWNQAEKAQEDRNKYGVHLSAALRGEKRDDEPEDARLDQVRELLSERDHYKTQLDLACQDGLTPADAKKLHEFNHGLSAENERLKSASSIIEFTDGLIASMFAMRWTGPESEDLQLAKATLYKSLKNQTDGFWSGHTAYHIMIDGGFLFDAKSNTNKVLTPLGRQFMRDIEVEALKEPKP